MTKIYLDRNVEDVNITTPADTELLVWDEATQQWVNAGMTIIPGSNITVDDTDPLNPIVGLVTTVSGIDYIQFDTAYSDGITEGRLQWNPDDGTLEIGMPGGSVNLQIGQENLIKVTNKTGITIPNGTAVFVNGAQGQRPTISGAIASTNVIANALLGVTTEDIAHDHFGYVSTQGLVRDVDTSAFTEGSILYLSDSTPGALTMTAPSAPNTVVGVAVCVYKHATEGILGVFPRILSVLASRSILNDAGGYYTGADVETALQEVGAEIDTHIGDSTIHYLQTSITNLSSSLDTGLVKLTTGTGALSTIADNSTNWDTAYGWGDHASAGYLTSGVALDHNSLPGLQGGQAGEYYHLNKSSIDGLTGGATVDATSQHNHSFSTLLDVENPTTSNNFFYWDNVNKIVKNVSIKEYLSIYDLSDVYVTGGATTGQVLTLVGSSWHNEALPTATDSAKGVVELATSAETTAGLAVQASDTRLSDARTPTAHNILNSTYHGDTLTGSATRGDIIYGNSTPKWARLAKGTSGYVLTAGASDISWAAIPNASTSAKGIVELALSSEISGNLVVQASDDRLRKIVFLTTPLTSTAWDGDARSTTAKTLIDMSAVFGLPAASANFYVEAVLVRLAARDSGSATSSAPYVALSPNNISGSAPLIVRPAGLPNDYFADYLGWVTCDANGDLYFQTSATGAGTLDVWIEIWGYAYGTAAT